MDVLKTIAIFCRNEYFVGFIERRQPGCWESAYSAVNSDLVHVIK
jgi:hypothetical protein